MKQLSDDPRFTSWLLGELPAADAEEMARRVAADPALQVAARHSQEFHEELAELFGASSTQLNPLQREKVLRAARRSQPHELQQSPRVTRSFASWWIAAAAAAAIVLGVWLQARSPISNGAAMESIAREISLLPIDAGTPMDGGASSQVGGTSQGADQSQVISGPAQSNDSDGYLQRMARDISAAPLPLVAELPEQEPRTFLRASSHPQVLLPLQAGTSSWKWMTRSIIEENHLPSPRMIRLEEMVNAFPVSDLPVLHATAAPSLTHKDRYWIFVSVNNHNSQAKAASLTYRAAASSSYRLVGFGSKRSLDLGATRQIPAHTQTTIMLEVLDSPATNLGSLELNMEGSTHTLPLHSATPDTHHRHLACVAAFGMLLGGENVDVMPIHAELAALEALSPSPAILSSLAIVKKGIAMVK